FTFFQNPNDLLFGKTTFLHLCSFWFGQKCLFYIGPIFGEQVIRDAYTEAKNAWIVGESIHGISKQGDWNLKSVIFASSHVEMIGMKRLWLTSDPVFQLPSVICGNKIHFDEVEEIILEDGVLYAEEITITKAKLVKVGGKNFASLIRAQKLKIEADHLLLCGGEIQAGVLTLNIKRFTKEAGSMRHIKRSPTSEMK
ncbi:MAG: hypothetical protein JSR80_03735, partial [Verrucomicrobia bacterium]|nr:hypothetical protein [Verrucomicrobiota bacterium]